MRPLSQGFLCNSVQGGSTRCIKSHCVAVWAVSGHNFMQGLRAGAHKNICDFAGDDRDGYLHNKSSHAHGKTANNFSLYFYIFPCITSQAMLGEIFQIYYQRTTCIRIKSCCYYGGLSPPVPFYRPSGLPFFHAEEPGIRFIRCIRLFLNSGPMNSIRRRKTRRSYLALASL